jgi:hypothetical protein
MLLQARLIHCEAGRRVVLVSALEGDRPLGSALGEAANAEAAEDRAIARLLARLGLARPAAAPAGLTTEAGDPSVCGGRASAGGGGGGSGSASDQGGGQERPEGGRTSGGASATGARGVMAFTSGAHAITADQPSAGPADHRLAFQGTSAAEAGRGASSPDPVAIVGPPEPPPDPEDWSEELARLDLQLKRLGWSREQEAIFLNRAFGHGARSRVTVYADLLAYLKTVEDLEHGADPASAPVPLRRHELLRQCDELLATLGWDRERARAFLSERLGVASRQHLGDEKVLEFNMLLEEEVMAVGEISSPDANSAPQEQNSGASERSQG